MSRLLFDMESTSVDIEHTIFTNSKSDIGYKTTMLKKVGSLRKGNCSKRFTCGLLLSQKVAFKPKLILSRLANEKQVAS